MLVTENSLFMFTEEAFQSFLNGHTKLFVYWTTTFSNLKRFSFFSKFKEPTLLLETKPTSDKKKINIVTNVSESFLFAGWNITFLQKFRISRFEIWSLLIRSEIKQLVKEHSRNFKNAIRFRGYLLSSTHSIFSKFENDYSFISSKTILHTQSLFW